MPTKEQLEQRLEAAEQQRAVLVNLVQLLQRKYQAFFEDVQAHIGNAQNQLGELDVEPTDD